MINLMYLVLTAMLALNVSASIINAFFKIDDGIQTTNGILGEANTKSLESMKATVEKKKIYQPLYDASSEAQLIVADFVDYIDEVRDELTAEAGGLYPDDHKDPTKAGRPQDAKNKEISTRLFVDGNDGSVGAATTPRGPEIRARIDSTRSKLVTLIKSVQGKKIEGTNIKDEDIAKLMDQLTLKVDSTGIDFSKPGNPWSKELFGYMPVAACYPILSKFQNDAKNSESAIINYLSSQIGATTIEFDKFQPVSSAKKGYIIKGDKYEADIFLSASSSQAGVSISVNGTRLPVKDGVAKYTATPSTYGEKKYKASISVNNPLTGKTDTYQKEFSYEVGERSVAVSLDKMNVFYIGVDNPVSVSVAGVNSQKVKVNGSSNIGLTKKGGGKYNARPTSPGKATITISADGMKPAKFDYMVKRIPDPTPMLSKKEGGAMGTGEFKAQGGLSVMLKNFDFDAKCSVQGYELTRVAKRQDPVSAPNRGARYAGRAANLVKAAKPGDTYYFDNIKAKCPGDSAGRKLPSIFFKIK